MKDYLNYKGMVERALRSVLTDTLKQVSEHGLRGNHNLYISFLTTHPGVTIAEYLHDKYPREMTIILQHQFWDLDVSEEGFDVTLSFNNVPERLSIPFEALTGFTDPSVQFRLQFKLEGEGATVDTGSGATRDVAATPNRRALARQGRGHGCRGRRQDRRGRGEGFGKDRHPRPIPQEIGALRPDHGRLPMPGDVPPWGGHDRVWQAHFGSPLGPGSGWPARSAEGLSLIAAEAMRDIEHLLRPGHLPQLAQILDDPEASDNGRFVAYGLLKNANIAAGMVLPGCQDTGTAIVAGYKGQYVWTDGHDAEALSRGIFKTSTETNLRSSIQIHRRENPHPRHRGLPVPCRSVHGRRQRPGFTRQG